MCTYNVVERRNVNGKTFVLVISTNGQLTEMEFTTPMDAKGYAAVYLAGYRRDFRLKPVELCRDMQVCSPITT